MRSSSNRFLSFSLCAILVIAGIATSALGQTIQINSIKANYLEGFIDFVRWDGKLKKENATIGVIGSHELVRHLQEIASQKTSGRTLKIVDVTLGTNSTDLTVLFIASGQREIWEQAIELSKAEHILLVGEEEGFLTEGGCIEFVLKRNLLSFKISNENSASYGIEVSSQLIEIAVE